jgi:hypothetical protein
VDLPNFLLHSNDLFTQCRIQHVIVGGEKNLIERFKKHKRESGSGKLVLRQIIPEIQRKTPIRSAWPSYLSIDHTVPRMLKKGIVTSTWIRVKTMYLYQSWSCESKLVEGS